MAHRLKIAHIITRLELGGAQQNTLYCCAHHDRRKYEVLLICGIGGYLDGEAKKIKDLKIHFLPELKHPISPIWDIKALGRITDILRSEKVDLVHTHSSKAGILGRWAARRAGVPHIVHTVHGWGFYPGQFLPIKKIYRTLERWAATFTDRIITVSQDNQKEGLDCGIGREDQYRVIHSGIDPKLYRLSSQKARAAKTKWGTLKRPSVLILSNFKKQKSPMDVVDTAQALVKKIPDVLFLWAGDGPLRDNVEGEIGRRGLEGNFNFLGWSEEVAKLLAATDALLLTSLHEGLPRVVLQAMAAQRPVVATAVNGTPEAVKDGVTGYLHGPHDPRAMAESLRKILTDRAMGRRMGEAGCRSLKGSFQIGVMLQQIEKLYDELTLRKK
jgi:glycosyltransferase involved in cell wall biosynthesis